MEDVSEDVSDFNKGDFDNLVLLSRTIKVLEDELKILMAQQSEIEKRRREVSSLLDDLVAVKLSKEVATERKKNFDAKVEAETVAADVAESSDVPHDVNPDVTEGIPQNLSPIFAESVLEPKHPIVEETADKDIIMEDIPVLATPFDGDTSSVIPDVTDIQGSFSTQSNEPAADKEEVVLGDSAGVQLLADSVGLVPYDEDESD